MNIEVTRATSTMNATSPFVGSTSRVRVLADPLELDLAAEVFLDIFDAMCLSCILNMREICHKRPMQLLATLLRLETM